MVFHRDVTPARRGETSETDDLEYRHFGILFPCIAKIVRGHGRELGLKGESPRGIKPRAKTASLLAEHRNKLALSVQ